MYKKDLDDILPETNIKKEYIDGLNRLNQHRDEAFIEASQYGYLNAMKILLAQGAWEKNTAFVAAAGEGQTRVMDYLLENGVDLNFGRGKLRREAFEAASEAGDLEGIRYLVNKGTDINLLGNTMAKVAVMNNSFPLLKFYVDNGGNFHQDNEDILKRAIEQNRLDMVKYLVENGADIKMIKPETIDFANRYGYKDIVKYLTDKGVASSCIIM